MIPIKSAREIEKMRQACRTASDILDRVSELVRPGITTKEVDEAAAAFMQEANVKSALAMRIRTIALKCFPRNISICEFIATKACLDATLTVSETVTRFRYWGGVTSRSAREPTSTRSSRTVSESR